MKELLDAFAASNPTAALSKARFVFDGDTIPLTSTIEQAGLEDDDQIELRL